LIKHETGKTENIISVRIINYTDSEYELCTGQCCICFECWWKFKIVFILSDFANLTASLDRRLVQIDCKDISMVGIDRWLIQIVR